MLTPTGSIVVDNVLWYGEVYPKPQGRLGTAIHEFNAAVAKDPRVNQVSFSTSHIWSRFYMLIIISVCLTKGNSSNARWSHVNQASRQAITCTIVSNQINIINCLATEGVN